MSYINIITIFVIIYIQFIQSKDYNFLRLGGIPVLSQYNLSIDTATSNTILLNDALQGLVSGDSLYFPNITFSFIGGVYVNNLYNVEIIIDGTLLFTNDRDTWPKDSDGSVKDCITFEDIEQVTFTSNGIGTLNGNGKKWWGAIDFLKHGEDRPMLFRITRSKDIIVENLLFKDSPYWTFFSDKSDGLIVRYSAVDARWDQKDRHTLLDLQAFNTDGFDVTGKNVYMHDLSIWNDDDCISVKDGSEDMLFERISASGLGLVIGSIGQTRVNNITFRDSVLHHTFKGIYMKTRWYDVGPIGETAMISNILYENITIDEPEQWGIWIGPAQQTGQPCPLYWPIVDRSECLMSGAQTWVNITLKDITINNPIKSPGVLLGNSSNPMQNVIFENVIINNPGSKPWGDDFYLCDGIAGIATGTTYPVPPCFTYVD